MDPVTSGRFFAGGEPLAGRDVLLFSDRPAQLQAVTRTGPDGGYSLSGDGTLLLGRSESDPVALACAPAESDELVPLGEIVELAVTIAGADRHPDRLQLFLDPVRVAGVPSSLQPFLTQREPGVFTTHMASFEAPAASLTIRVQAGTWRIGGSFLIHERPNIVKPDFKNWVVAAATAGEEELRGSETQGFQIDVGRHRAVTVRLREVPDSEL
jgi:hypothetical protein